MILLYRPISSASYKLIILITIFYLFLLINNVSLTINTTIKSDNSYKNRGNTPKSINTIRQTPVTTTTTKSKTTKSTTTLATITTTSQSQQTSLYMNDTHYLKTISNDIYASDTTTSEYLYEPDVKPSSPTFIFMAIVYILSTLSAIVSNLIVILVYKFGHRSTTANDLSLFLVNLAIADFLMSSVCMPFTFAQALFKKWMFGEILCPIVLFKQVLTVSLSIYTLVVIGIDRYIAVKSPLKNRVTHRNGKMVILVVWIISISLASVQLFVARISLEPPLNSTCSLNSTNCTQDMTNNDSQIVQYYVCNENWSSKWTRQTYTLFNFFAVYLIPVFILAYTYSCIACIIKKTTHPGNADLNRDIHYNKSKRKVIKMLIILVCVFTLCWLPLHVFTLISDFTSWLDDLQDVVWYYTAAHWLAMSDVYSLICCNCLPKSWFRNDSSRTNTSLVNPCKKIPKSNIYQTNITKRGKTNNNYSSKFHQNNKAIIANNIYDTNVIVQKATNNTNNITNNGNSTTKNNNNNNNGINRKCLKDVHLMEMTTQSRKNQNNNNNNNNNIDKRYNYKDTNECLGSTCQTLL